MQFYRIDLVMKKSFLFTLLVFILSLNYSFAQAKFDTLQNAQVAPGVWHLKLQEPKVPWLVNVLIADLKNPYLKIESIKGNDALGSLEKTTSMALRNSQDGHYVVGAINADYWSSNNPTGPQIVKGEVVKNTGARSTLSFDDKGAPAINRLVFSGTVITDSGVNSINGVNKTRETNQLILYNKFFGASTGANEYGSDAVLRNIDPWIVNDTIRLVVENKFQGVANVSIPSGNIVLSGHGTSQTFINDKIYIGDTIKLILRFAPLVNRIMELVGGSPKIVSEGVNYVDQGYIDENGPSHTYQREPRTGAGFSQDSSLLYLFVADGRQQGSLGMTLHELADLMLKMGVHYGMNLDGGGSSTMVVHHSIVNAPSDGTERNVVNSLQIISSAPKGTLNGIQLTPTFKKIYKGEKLQFSVKGVDEFYYPVDLNPVSINYSISHDFGTITSGGELTAGTKSDTGYVFVEYEGFRDSALIIVKEISRISISPKDVVTDTFRTVTYKVKAYDFDNVQRAVTVDECQWSVSDTTIGRISSSGVFEGKRNGETKVFADFNGIKDSASITIELGWDGVLIDDFEDIGSWTLSGENIDTVNSSISITSDYFFYGEKSIRIDYRFVYQAVMQYIYINNDYLFYGAPDSIHIKGRSNNVKHQIIYLVSDDNDELFQINTTKYFESEQFEDYDVAVSKAVAKQGGSDFNYPIRLKKIGVKLNSSKKVDSVYSGTLYLDYLRISYPQEKVGVVENRIINPSAYELFQNYPNPFNNETVIEYYIPVQAKINLKVYDILGREAAVLVDEIKNQGHHKANFNSSMLSSGVYFYRIQAGDYNQTRKMILLK